MILGKFVKFYFLKYPYFTSQNAIFLDLTDGGNEV